MHLNVTLKLANLLLISTILAGCTQVVTAPPSQSDAMVTHVIYTSSQPSNPDVITRLEFYLSEQGDRMMIKGNDNDFPEQWFSDTATGTDYFTGPIVGEQMRAEVPPASPYKNVDGATIIKLDTNTTTPPQASQMNIPRRAAAEVLTVNPTWLNSILNDPYTVITEPYETDPEANGQRRITLNPTTNHITRIEKFIVDTAGQEQIYQVIVVEKLEEIPLTDLPADFFTLEGWQRDLPQDKYTIVVDDLD